jgi:hypothetical protein
VDEEADCECLIPSQLSYMYLMHGQQ